ncbi:MAG: HAD-IA family hydrolase [Methylococcaceae bacterium]|nr:HAD-IA family hydrolase [Methylococcaceae bacterium]
MKNRFDLLVFDWDGTLFDSIPFIVDCLQGAARDCGLPVPSDTAARGVIGLSLDQAMLALFPVVGSGRRADLIEAYRRFYERRPACPQDLFHGVAAMLEQLKRAGYRLAVASGKTSTQLTKAIAATGTAGWFDALRGPDQTASKPDPLMLQEIMADLGSAPERTLMIGDSVHDLQMAANARVEAVAVTCGANSRAQLMAFNPLHCLQQTRELAAILV